MIDKKHTNAPVGIVPLRMVISTEELDKKVDTFTLSPHAGWVDDYIKKAKRRKDDD